MTTQTTATGKIFTEILRWFTIQKDFFGKFIYKIIRQNKLKEFTGSGVEYWEQRHKKFGARSVVNLAHPEEEFEKVTRMQKERLFTILKKQVSGNENLILDFGCGPGRFTGGLADIINGKAIGVEPSRHLLSLAPKQSKVFNPRNRPVSRNSRPRLSLPGSILTGVVLMFAMPFSAQTGPGMQDARIWHADVAKPYAVYSRHPAHLVYRS